MPSRFDQRFNAFSVPQLQREHGVESVTLKRGALETATFTARRRQIQPVELGSDVGISVAVDMREWKVPRAKVILAGQTVEPRPNDLIIDGTDTWQIRQGSDDTQAVYEDGTGFYWICNTERHLT